MTVYVEPVRKDFWQLARTTTGDYVDPLGPKNCMTHSAARMVMRATEGKRPAAAVSWPPTGYEIRRHCLDPESGKVDTTGGVFHSQVASAVRRMYGVNLTIYNGNSFDDLVDLSESTRGVSVSFWYRRFRDDSRFRGSFEFYQNHEMFLSSADRARAVFRNGVDPLADGRRPGLAEGPMDYPFNLVRAAAGELNISASGYRALGMGRAYFMVTEPTFGVDAKWWPSWMPAPPPNATFSLTVKAGTTFNTLDSAGRYVHQWTTKGGFTAYGNSRKRLASGALIGNLITGPYRGYVRTSIGNVRNKPQEA